MAAADGGVFAYGDAVFHGSANSQLGRYGIVGIAPTKSGGGYWLVGVLAVYPFGDAESLGDLEDRAPGIGLVGMAAAPDGAGYWLVARDGGTFCFGDAPFFSIPHVFIVDVVGIVAAPAPT